MTAHVELYCPNCGKLVQADVSEGERTDHKVTCASCGATSELGHLKTADGKTLLRQAQDMAEDAIKGRK